MTHPVRLELPGACYHVTTRGNARELIFRDNRDRRTFLAVLEDVLGGFGWECLGYCLLGNHYHLVMRTPQPNLARGMRHLNGVYAQRFNRRWSRGGPLYDKRYGSVLVQENQHLLNVIRYVALNAVAAGLCKHPDDWPWSGHREMIGGAQQRLVHAGALSELLGVPPARALKAYRELLAQPGDPPPDDVAVIGEPDFVEAALAQTSPSEDVARSNWQNGRPALADVLDESDPATIAVARRRYGYTLAEIGKQLGVHRSTVSKRMPRGDA